MAIITISRGSYSMGKAVAEGVASRLGYECLSRDVLLEASGLFNVPEVKLRAAITDAPSVLERLTHGRARYVAFFQSALLRHLCRQDIVYHGLAGHARLRSVSHILRVRILAEIELRVEVVRRREQLSAAEAAAWIRKLDSDRRKWTRTLHHVDPWDPSLYDMVLNIPRFSVDDAVALICEAVSKEQFQPTAEAQQQLEDLSLACEVKAGLVTGHPDAMVTATSGNVLIYCGGGDRHASKVNESAKKLCADLPAVNNYEVHVGVAPPANAV